MNFKQLTLAILAVSLSINPAVAAPVNETDLAAVGKPLFTPDRNPATQYDNLLFPASADNKYGYINT